ncbi:hypothetical protein HK405_010082 [Cladochytrium tenue]|nr:hypothetical protein HK405_010082 [Cladochytrium tenue]
MDTLPLDQNPPLTTQPTESQSLRNVTLQHGNLSSFIARFFQWTALSLPPTAFLASVITVSLLVLRLIFDAACTARSSSSTDGLPFREDSIVFSVLVYNQARHHEGAILYAKIIKFALASAGIANLFSVIEAVLWIFNRQMDYMAVIAISIAVQGSTAITTYIDMRAQNKTRVVSAVTAVVVTVVALCLLFAT